MDSSENLSHEPRNLNAEWAMLKEMASNGSFVADTSVERAANDAERAKYRRYGKILLDIIDRMPDKPDLNEKTAKLEKIYRVARRAGVKDSIDASMEYKHKRQADYRVGREIFGDSQELSEQEEAKVEQLREKVVDLTEAAPGALAEEFPSGNYLYHGSSVGKLEQIFRDGVLKNSAALAEDDPNFDPTGMNSGFEGISWSMDGIDALPGTRGHLAGFLAAPENILDDSTRLVVPSRPSPYEVLQVNKKIEPEEFYNTKIQLETWGNTGASLGEGNNVDSNLMRMLMHEKGDIFTGQSLVYDYQGDLSAEKLRKYYTLGEDGKLTWDVDIAQKFEVPPALPWMQSLIDRGVFARNELEGLDDVRKVIDYARTNKEFVQRLIAMERSESDMVRKQHEQMLGGVKPVRVNVKQMYFVAPHRDLDAWLRVMARTGAEPKGILLYDDDSIVLENFGSDYEGNHKELSQEIGRAVGVKGGFWQDEMGFDPESMPRSGYKGQVLLESTMKHDEVIQLGNDGQLKVTRLGNEETPTPN